MSDNFYSNQWNEDDFQKQDFSTYSEPAGGFNYSGTNLTKKKKKEKKIGRGKSVALVLAAAVFGSAVTMGAGAMLIPGYIDSKISSSSGTKSYDVTQLASDKDTSLGNLAVPSEKKDDKEVLTIPQIAKKVAPATVGINCEFKTQSYFGIQTQQGSGSGFIISEDGYIITNHHVIENASAITVLFNDGTESKDVEVVGSDSRTDLAVLKLKSGGPYYYAELGESGSLEVGELAVAIGNPLGSDLAGSVTVGVISALNREMTVENKTLTLLQTDAAINPGNSGGPLVNCYGEVIGINSMKLADSTIEGLGFAIPMDEAKPIFEDLMKHGYVKGRPVLGISGVSVSQEESEYYGFPVGVFVQNVSEGSGAAAAGIKRGDIITKVDDTRVKSVEEINRIKNKKKAGQQIKVELDRSGEIITVNVTLGEETK